MTLSRRLPAKSPSFLTVSLSGLLAGAFALSGCAGGGGGWDMPPPVVETTLAVQRPWTVSYQASGTLEADNKVDLNTEAPGIVTQINVREGETVRAGQVLMRFKADKQLAQLQQSAAGIGSSQGGVRQQKADVQQAQARLQSANARFKLAQSEYGRYQKLFADEFVSQLELDQKRSAYDTALADQQEAQQALISAQAQFSQAASGLAQARSTYRYNAALAEELVVRAPFAGIVGQKYVDLGDYVAPTEKLITVVDRANFKIQFAVPERFLGQLRLGLPVKVTFEGLSGRVFPGRVNFIDPVVDATAHTVSVKALLPGSSLLKHGLFGNVALALGVIPDAVVIPEEAIVPQGEKSFVYVVRHEVYRPKETGEAPAKKPAKPEDNAPKDVAHLQEVTPGYREAGQVQLKAGLRPGERVIISGLQKVSDNLPVNLDQGSGGAAAPAKGR